MMIQEKQSDKLGDFVWEEAKSAGMRINESEFMTSLRDRTAR
jgi:hypothetical protein